MKDRSLKRLTVDEVRQKGSSKKVRAELEALARMPGDQIDYSDIPPLTPEQVRPGVRGRFYRPVKKLVSIRLDADIIEWLKNDDRPYQTKANALLRREMLRDWMSELPTGAKPKQRKPGTR